MEQELLPCPFCGSTNLDDSMMGAYPSIDCIDCSATVTADYEKDAIAKWNHRFDGWIPVSERLPEMDRDLLVTYLYGEDKTPYNQWSQYTLNDENEPEFVFYSSDELEHLGGVIAWMYLPKPYEASK